jgi:2-amino-4-hydroxy-6-hydroxymethyldihydropteridine diphosphokinase
VAPGARASVALGANLDDPVATMIAAGRALARLGALGPVSSLWRTDPVGGPPDQPTYRNAVVVWHPAPPWATPAAALAALLAIEQALGRERRDRWGPRRIDLDLLAWSPPSADSAPHEGRRAPWRRPDLPHPRAFERPFVLVPWAEVEPAWRDPASGATVAATLAATGRAGVGRVATEEARRWSAALGGPSGTATGPG